jgi:hypothetical protein
MHDDIQYPLYITLVMHFMCVVSSRLVYLSLKRVTSMLSIFIIDSYISRIIADTAASM